MAPANNFLPFCPTDTGTNLLSQSDYAAAANRTDGNQPGIASSKLNNKALRQATYVTGQMAQFLANQLNSDVLDDNTPARLLAQFMAALKPYAPRTTKVTATGAGTWNMQYIFFIASGNATAGATYTNNAVTFTVVSTVAGATEVKMTGNGDPSVSGTLTKASGTGDATLTFYAFRKPIALEVYLVGAGGGGSESGTTSGTTAGNGGDSTFGASTAGAGIHGTYNGSGGTGGTATLGTGHVGIGVKGGGGQGGGTQASSNGPFIGGQGGVNFLGGAGVSGGYTSGGSTGAPNSGAGGGAGSSNNVIGSTAGSGGGAGAALHFMIESPLSTYAYTVGAGGTAGIHGVSSSGLDGAVGADGLLVVIEHY